MQMVAIAIVALVVVLISYLVARRTAMGDEINRALREGADLGLVGFALARHVFVRVARPAIMQAGWGSLVILGISGIVPLILILMGSPWWIVIVTFLAGSSALLIRWLMTRPQNHLSILRLVGASSLTLYATGAVANLIALFARDNGLVNMSVMLMLSGIAVAYVFCSLTALIGVKLVDLGEGVLGSGWKVLKAMAATAGVPDSLLGDGPNLADQEEFLPDVNAFFRGIIAMHVPHMVLSLLFTHEVILSITPVSALVVGLLWFGLESAGVSTLSRRMRAARLLETIGIAALVLRIVFVVAPVVMSRLPESSQWRTKFDALSKASSLRGLDLLDAVTNGLGWMVAILLAALALRYLPKLAPETAKRTRGFLYAVSVLALMVCFGGLFYVVLGERVANAATSVTLKFVPIVEATQGKSLVIKWPTLPGDKTYRIQLRKDDQAEYCELQQVSSHNNVSTVCGKPADGSNKQIDSGLNVAHGVTSYRYAGVTPGTYFVRVIAISPDGSREESTETGPVVVPDPSAPAPATSGSAKAGAPPKGAPKAEPAADPCVGGTCDDPKNTPYCRRHPDRCKD